jgi:RimJ/RimL family protein N-acetyltransferase
VTVPELTTSRLLLHPLTADEARAIRGGGTLRAWPFAEGYPLPDTYDGLGLFLRHGNERFGFSLVVRREDGLVIGEIGFVGPPASGKVAIGYAIVPAARRHGYATEAIRALSGWALAQEEVEEVRALVARDNEPSAHALLRAGFVEAQATEKARSFVLSAG